MCVCLFVFKYFYSLRIYFYTLYYTKFYFIRFVYVMYVLPMCTACMSSALGEKGIESHRIEVTDGCKLPRWCGELNPGLLQNQQVFLTADQPPHLYNVF